MPEDERNTFYKWVDQQGNIHDRPFAAAVFWKTRKRANLEQRQLSEIVNLKDPDKDMTQFTHTRGNTNQSEWEREYPPSAPSLANRMPKVLEQCGASYLEAMIIASGSLQRVLDVSLRDSKGKLRTGKEMRDAMINKYQKHMDQLAKEYGLDAKDVPLFPKTSLNRRFWADEEG